MSIAYYSIYGKMALQAFRPRRRRPGCAPTGTPGMTADQATAARADYRQRALSLAYRQPFCECYVSHRCTLPRLEAQSHAQKHSWSCTDRLRRHVCTVEWSTRRFRLCSRMMKQPFVMKLLLKVL